MTDRVKGLTVVLDQDIRIDDIQTLIDCIKMFRNVSSVEPVITEPGDFIDRKKITHDIKLKFYKFIEEI